MLEPIIKQPVVIETKAGAPARSARNSPPTPSRTATRCSRNTSISGFAEMDRLFGRAPKFTHADFIPIARFIADPSVLVVNDQQPYKTLKELVDDAKKRPNEIVFSSSRSLRRAAHADGAVHKAAGGLKLRHLPTNGGGPALTALLGNNSQVLASSISAALTQIKAGKCARWRCSAAKRSKVAAERADHEGARLRRRILALGRHVRPQGHAGRQSSTSCATSIDKAAHTEQFKNAIDQSRPRPRLSRQG